MVTALTETVKDNNKEVYLEYNKTGKSVNVTTPLTNEEEITSCKGWVHVSEIMPKTVCPIVARFYEVHDNALRKARESVAGDEDYIHKSLLDYEAEFGQQLHFVILWRFKTQSESPKWWEQEVPKFLKPNASKISKTSRSSSFNTESENASFNLNVDAEDDDENEMHEVPRPIGRDKAKGSKKKGFGSSDHR
uniref:Uncharacterized protein n=1 Tax=Tanacetum cinerariifolium TaxID=118510 RepID=A0A699I2Z3_TANCI|nr:hypothetical protein [Tanacetum cinerariifolium]